MSATVYRFLPWSRRGLSAAIPDTASGAAIPARARVDVTVMVAGAGPAPTSATLHGPGDVVGLDPAVVVRTIPRPGSTNVEPNYLATIDFDQPELPWLFTPIGVPTSGHLPPWLVLVVVRDRPGVSVSVPQGPGLPVLRIDSGAAGELPDLEDSWAWAHAQLLDEDSGPTAAAVGQALADHPNRNVSRLVCPRRLEPDARWIACVVPAFDAGVARGLGQEPAPGDLSPAWTAPDSVLLPVYHHWSFQTGPQGDFESLARRLKPYEASARIGRVRMHIGDASGFVDLPDGDPDRFLDMDGALQAPEVARTTADPPVPDPSLGEVSRVIRNKLQAVGALLADAADGKLDGEATGESEALGPPVYAGAHIRRTTVGDGDDEWFRELNLDPRCRVAAGLGAEVMRKFQEDVMEAAWQQVGDVIATESALSRARLSLEVGLRFHARHLEPLPVGRLLQLTAPLADRTLVGARSLPAAVAPTSFPDRANDAAMRRYTSARGRVLAGVARRAGSVEVTTAVRKAGERLVSSLAEGRADLDATRFAVPALDGLGVTIPSAGADGTVSLERLGVAVTVDRAGATALRAASRALSTTTLPPTSELVRPRPDLRTTGMVTSVHLGAARTIAGAQLEGRLVGQPAGQAAQLTDLLTGSSEGVLDLVLTTAGERPGGAGFLIEAGGSIVVRPLAVRGGGEVVVLTRTGRPNVTIARLDDRLHGGAGEVGELIGRLPAGSIAPLTVRPGGVLVEPPVVRLRPGAGAGEIAVLPGGGQLGHGGVVVAPVDPGMTVTMPPLVLEPAAISRFEVAVAELGRRTVAAEDAVVPHLVAFPISEAVSATLVRSDPRTVHPARLDTMIRIADHGLAALLADPTLVPEWRLPRLFDRVMTYPVLELPAYQYLVAYDRDWFCPGVDEVPPDSVTLLETNPRFIAGFMGGLNHETSRELLWRSYPTDSRGTPWRKFWKRTDARPDIDEIHTWGPRGSRSDLPVQTTDPLGNLVLMVRGELLRRYPRTNAVAVRAVRAGNGPQRPSLAPEDLLLPVFAGQFDPDVSFFGFPLVNRDLTDGEGWFFGLMEPVTEPRFGFDVTPTKDPPTRWDEVAWDQVGVLPGQQLTHRKLSGVPIGGSVGQADGVAAALFQRPFKLLVHARHLVRGI